jgi:hypothetical protein
MNRIFCILLFFVAFFSAATAQIYNPLFPPNTYRNTDNPLYWKNRKPSPGYWQQDVHYTIKANINERNDIVSGTEELIYWNNSPDELEFVFFHLYPNAFQPGSYYHDLHLSNNIEPRFGKYEEQGLGLVINSIMVNDKAVKLEKDNTIMKVWLPEKLKSGESVRINIDFNTFFDPGGSIRRRQKMFIDYGNKHYDGVHWYPRIAVYDAKFGWSTNQHLGREYYGNYGTYDVELTFASNFIVEATGNLINKEEVLPEDLRKRLDLKNFARKPLFEPPSIIIPYDSTQRKVWKFHAENVHDFAWTADPTYRIGEAEWNGVKIIALAREPNAIGWQYAADFTAKVIQVYSEDIGMYEYPKMVVADAKDGMEYPMLTLCGGFDPDHRGLIAHEVAHNWFYGMVANNETYRAFMDEGFTQFLTAHGLRRIDGEEEVRFEPRDPYLRKFLKPENTLYSNLYYGYLSDAIESKDAFLNTHSDKFGGAIRHGGGYRQVYYKTGVMLYNLQYVLGDSLFWAAMQNYFNEWKFCHPYPEDFRNSIIRFTKVDLNWFFDQWIETVKQIDYGVKSVKKSKGKDNYIITFKRKGRMEMPIDFDVISNDGTTRSFHIPNNWFVKQTNARVLPRWIGWDKLQPEYQAEVHIPGGIQNVIIDPSERLADVYMLDNSLKFPISAEFDHKIYNSEDRKNLETFYRPEIWYNGFDGLKLGAHSNGHYFNEHHVYSATAWYNTGFLQNQAIAAPAPSGFDQFNFSLSYKTLTKNLLPGSYVFASANALEGLRGGTLGIEKWNSKKNQRWFAYLKGMYRPNEASTLYLLYPQEWLPGRFNNTFNLGMNHNYRYQRGTGDINLLLRTSAFTNDYNFSTIALNVVNKNQLGPFDFNTRTFGQMGIATALPRESALFLYGANPEELMENKFTRSAGFFPSDWTNFGAGINHFHHGGGLNLRGYSGYLAPVNDRNENQRLAYRGLSGASVNAELGFDRLLRLMPRQLRSIFKFNTYLFADAGIINMNFQNEPLSFAPLRADAGIGTALTIKRWGPLQMVKPLTIRFDMPLWVNRPPAAEDFFQMRWVIGINRAF